MSPNLFQVIQPYTSDALHRANDQQLIERTRELLQEMDSYYCDAMRYRWLRDHMYVEDGCLEIGLNITCNQEPNRADVDTAFDRSIASASEIGRQGKD